MFSFFDIWSSIGLLVVTVGFFVFGLYKHEQRLQLMEKQITANQEKFINR